MANINVDSKPGGATGKTVDAGNPANPKEKTPMCLINELSRFNKLKHQYTLVDEQGPAHKKTFFVQLKLGDEEYNSTEGSIKRAQHLAAQQAIQKTKYPHPPPKFDNKAEALGEYDAEADKIIRLKPAVAPNPPGFKKQQKPAASAASAPPLTGSLPFQKSIKARLGDGIVQLTNNRPAAKQMAQKSIDRAKTFMQNRNMPQNNRFQTGQTPLKAFGSGYNGPRQAFGNSSFGNSSFGNSSFGNSSPALKRPRLELPPPPRPNQSGLSEETVSLKRERLEQEWEKISLQRQMLEIEKERLKMETDKYQYEVRLLEYQLRDYEKTAGQTGTGYGTRREDGYDGYGTGGGAGYGTSGGAGYGTSGGTGYGRASGTYYDVQPSLSSTYGSAPYKY